MLEGNNEKDIVYIENIIFLNKQNIPWKQVEKFLKKYIGTKHTVAKLEDVICIGSDFPEEYAESKYTKRLRGNIAKAKANAAQVIGEMIVIATNKRWIDNKDEKHKKRSEYAA